MDWEATAHHHRHLSQTPWLADHLGYSPKYLPTLTNLLEPHHTRNAVVSPAEYYTVHRRALVGTLPLVLLSWIATLDILTHQRLDLCIVWSPHHSHDSVN